MLFWMLGGGGCFFVFFDAFFVFGVGCFAVFLAEFCVDFGVKHGLSNKDKTF